MPAVSWFADFENGNVFIAVPEMITETVVHEIGRISEPGADKQATYHMGTGNPTYAFSHRFVHQGSESFAGLGPTITALDKIRRIDQETGHLPIVYFSLAGRIRAGRAIVLDYNSFAAGYQDNLTGYPKLMDLSAELEEDRDHPFTRAALLVESGLALLGTVRSTEAVIELIG